MADAVTGQTIEIQATITDSGTGDPVNLTGATVTMRAYGPGGQTVTLSGSDIDVTDETGGAVTATWAAAQNTVAGTWDYEFAWTYASGAVGVTKDLATLEIRAALP